jgi:hypothetical protein
MTPRHESKPPESQGRRQPGAMAALPDRITARVAHATAMPATEARQG